LLFGKQPQRFFISSEVKCLHFHGTQKIKPILSYQIYKGTVFEVADQAIDFLLSKLNRTVGTRQQSVQVPVEYDIPKEVVSEAIVSAIVHRDYYSPASVEVALYSDRLEVWNPGQLPKGLNLQDLAKPHTSYPVNPLIAEPMFLAKYIEKVGTGTTDIIEKCQQAVLPAPRFEEKAGCFVITIYKTQETPKKVQPID
jgi:predicted HTH transcriptional regulator